MKPPSALSALIRTLRWHRRWLAALLAAVAVMAGVSAASQPSGRLTWAVVAARDLSGGERVTDADLTRVSFPAQFLPDRYLTDPGQAVGRVLTVSLPRNAIVVDSAVLSSAGAEPGMAITPVTLPGVAAGLIQVGERIDLFVPGDEEPSRPAAAQALVVAVPHEEGGNGLLSGGSTGGTVVVLVKVQAATAALLATSAAPGGLGFALR